MLESQFRIYFLLTHVSQSQFPITSFQDIQSHIDQLQLQESDFISFTQYYDSTSRTIKLRYLQLYFPQLQKIPLFNRVVRVIGGLQESDRTGFQGYLSIKQYLID